MHLKKNHHTVSLLLLLILSYNIRLAIKNFFLLNSEMLLPVKAQFKILFVIVNAFSSILEVL